jgi:hypothetical protein
MGDGLKAWSQQAAGQPPGGYEPHVLYPWSAIVANVDPGAKDTGSNFSTTYEDFFGLDVDGDFNIAAKLYALRREDGGSAYENVEAFNPDSYVARIDRALDDMLNAVADHDPDAKFGELMTLLDEHLDEMVPDAEIDAAVDAHARRTETDHLQQVSNVYMGLWEAGAVLSTQTMGAMAILEDGRQRTLSEYDAKLRLAQADRRAGVRSQMVGLVLQFADRSVSLKSGALQGAMEAMRYVTTVKQDQIDKDVEYMNADLFWDVSLLQQALNANSAIYGAQIVPRSQTKGERLLAAITGSGSMGIQGGMATGSPEIGALMGLGNLMGNLLLM